MKTCFYWAATQSHAHAHLRLYMCSELVLEECITLLACYAVYTRARGTGTKLCALIAKLEITVRVVVQNYARYR